MAQHDMTLADQAGLAFLADLNDAVAALVSNNSGATAPATTYPYMWWADTTAGLLKQRNAANSAWITIGTLASTALGLLQASSNLSDVASASTARTNLGAAASGAVTGSGLTMATARLVGRTTAGTGAPEEISATEGVQLAGGNIKADVNALTEDTTPDTANDFALVWDASASAHKKVKLNKIGSAIGQSMVRLNTANGYGSTNTKIRRFTNTVTNTGSDITYADSATNGASFTINTSGVYAISYNDQFSSGSYVGISKNSSQLTTSIETITVSDIVGVAYMANASAPVACGCTLYLTAGDVIRAHTGGVSAGTIANGVEFTITRVA